MMSRMVQLNFTAQIAWLDTAKIASLSAMQALQIYRFSFIEHERS